MFHPFLWVSESSRTRVFWGFFAIAAALMIVMQLLGAPLKTAVAPAGIVSYELAGSAAVSQRILASWDARIRAYAGLNLGLDYLFIVSYVGAIGMGCSLLAVRIRQRARVLAWTGIVLAWGQLLAGALDALENVALLRLLVRAGTADGLSAWPAVARACAIPKFLIVVLSLLYLLVAGVVALAGRGSGRQAARVQ